MSTELKDYGFTGADFIAAREIIREKNQGNFIPARITESRRERFKCVCEYGEVPAEIKGSFYHNVDFLGHAEGYAKNVKEQVNAANFDYVSSLNFDLNLKRLARYLTASLQSGGFPVFVLTKADIVDDPNPLAAELRKMAKEVPVMCISSKTGYGLEELTPFLEPAKTAVFLVSSGVEKSSLLFRLPSGSLVIDTPGMRELGLWDSREGISLAFPEVEELFSRCRFNNCAHEREPGCAVLAALQDGSLSQEQWKSYLAQRRETSFVLSHSAYLKQKQEFHKAVARNSRARKKRDGYFGE